MSKKTSALIFAAGAVAGWKIAQRVAGEAQDAPWVGAEPAPASPVASGTDPFRGAFRQAAEVDLYRSAEDETEVA